MGHCAFGREGKQALWLFAGQEGAVTLMDADAGELALVEPCPTQCLFFHTEPQRLYQVKLTASVGTEADDVACIGRNLWFKKNNIEHNSGDYLSSQVGMDEG